MTEEKVGLTAQAFEAAFPFAIRVDGELRLRWVGASLRKLCPEASVGTPLGDLVQPVRPALSLTPEDLEAACGQLCIWQIVDSAVRLRGSIVRGAEDGRFVFLWSPWLTDPLQIVELGLRVQDFGVQDSVVDLLQIVQTHRMALDDAKQLAARLEQANTELQERNRRLHEVQVALEHEQRETRKLALIASRTDNAVVLTDAEGRVEWVNEGFTRLTGYDLSEVLG
ncbi:MAG: PAS domain-containing protein, partial [Planctomycetota bacterium]